MLAGARLTLIGSKHVYPREKEEIEGSLQGTAMALLAFTLQELRA